MTRLLSRSNTKIQNAQLNRINLIINRNIKAIKKRTAHTAHEHQERKAIMATNKNNTEHLVNKYRKRLAELQEKQKKLLDRVRKHEKIERDAQAKAKENVDRLIANKVLKWCETDMSLRSTLIDLIKKDSFDQSECAYALMIASIFKISPTSIIIKSDSEIKEMKNKKKTTNEPNGSPSIVGQEETHADEGKIAPAITSAPDLG